MSVYCSIDLLKHDERTIQLRRPEPHNFISLKVPTGDNPDLIIR